MSVLKLFQSCILGCNLVVFSSGLQVVWVIFISMGKWSLLIVSGKTCHVVWFASKSEINVKSEEVSCWCGAPNLVGSSVLSSRVNSSKTGCYVGDFESGMGVFLG